MSLPLLLFIILARPLLGAVALASRLFLFSFIFSLMSSRLCWKDFFWARSFTMAHGLRLLKRRFFPLAKTTVDAKL